MRERETPPPLPPFYLFADASVIVSNVPVDRIPTRFFQTAEVVIVNGIVVKNRWGVDSRDLVLERDWKKARESQPGSYRESEPLADQEKRWVEANPAARKP